MTNDQYICQRAANAILSEIGPYQISSDALQSVNQFLDQCLFLVLQNTTLLDLSHLKAQILALLPHRLGRNAIVEAELEVKAYSDTNDVDTCLYERMLILPNPVDQIWTSLRTQCLKQCALADKAIIIINDSEQHLVLSPIVVIFVTAVLEHIAEYILTTIAVTAEHQGSDYIRVKEVYWALLQDTQVGGIFKQTDMRSKLEKRVMSSYSSPHYQSPPPPPELPAKPQTPIPRDAFDHRTPELYSGLDDDDDDEDEDEDEILPSSHTARTSSSIKSGQSISSYRPISVLSNGTTATDRSTSSSKKTFRFFGKKGKKRSSVASHSTTGTNRSGQQERTMSPDSPSSVVQVYDIDTPALDFEDLMRSGNTMKVSLTPNRLRSIEIKSLSSPLPPTATTTTTTTTTSRPSPTGAPFENPRAAPKPPINEKSTTPPMTPNSSIASRISNPRSSPPAALQLVGHKFSQSRNSVDTTDVSAMDLPSPPSTIDRHPSSFDRSDTRHTQHFNRPSSIVAKRASGRARPASYHENFALTMEQQRRSKHPNQPLPPPQQQQQPPHVTTAPSLSTPTNDTIMRRRRPFSQIITEEDEKSTNDSCIHPSLLSLANMDNPVPLQDKDTTAATTTTSTSTTSTTSSMDAAIQTDPLPGIPSLASLLTARSRQLPVPTLIITEEEEDNEQGMVDGDEEWFIQDWDDVHDSVP